VLDTLPLTATGKVNRNALPLPEQARPELGQAYVAPRTAVEEVLCGVFSEVLQIEPVGVRDSFFELGGHSLLATQVSSRVRIVFQVELPLRGFFEAPTVERLAATILKQDRERVERTAELLLKLSTLSDEDAENFSHGLHG
jgi:acyl carrier protein